MALLEWKEEFSIGIASVDFEHRELIGFINQLHEHLTTGDSEFAVADFLGELCSMISAHFALEEQTMRRLNYDRLAEHKDDHEFLLDDIRNMMDDCNSDALAARLGSWFEVHFHGMDARLHKHLTMAGRSIKQ
jgi:hemerythrin